jgi:hypothetical protein
MSKIRKRPNSMKRGSDGATNEQNEILVHRSGTTANGIVPGRWNPATSGQQTMVPEKFR